MGSQAMVSSQAVERAGSAREGAVTTMAQVVLLRGVNVGGHKTFKPTALVEQLRHLEVVNIGAAGTFVVRRPMARAALRAEFARRLPFATQIVILPGREIVSLLSHDPFASQTVRAGEVRFVSVLSGRPRSEPALPVSFPASGRWLLRLVARQGRCVCGLYRRHMRVISYLGKLDSLLGVPVTTRNWNTVAAIAEVLSEGAAGGRGRRRRPGP